MAKSNLRTQAQFGILPVFEAVLDQHWTEERCESGVDGTRRRRPAALRLQHLQSSVVTS